MSVLLVVFTGCASSQHTQPAPKYAAHIPPSIQTPDTVRTRIGTLKFFDGLPDEATVQKVYDNLDFARGMAAFMAGMPAASVQALSAGFSEAGFAPNHQGSLPAAQRLAPQASHSWRP